MATRTPYTTIQPTFGAMPTWLTNELDRQRIMAYQRYEEMYWNEPDAYKLILRGNESNPIFVPSAMTIIEACNRYLAKDWTFVADPKLGAEAEQQALTTQMTMLFRREQMWTKFLTQKRYGLIRGDACWMIIGDPAKLPGSRLRILEVDPASVFPITDPADEDRITGYHVVDQTLGKDEKTVIIKRQTYRKNENGTINYDLSWWQLGAWDDRNLDPKDLKRADQPPSPATNFDLPAQITALPIYHIKNNRTPSAPFGSSEMRGMETLAAGISQTISDEELALALAGLGIYVTTSGPPVDDDGNETTWKIGPGYVAEIDPEADWKRVNGVTSVDPSQAHAKYLESKMREARGVPDVAIGNVDVQVAESGIALALKMAPIISANAEKEQEMLGVYDHMLYDISRMWFPAYEGMNFGMAAAVSVVGDPLPINREKTVAEILQLVEAGFMTLEYGRQLLSEKLGYEFPESMGEAVVTEMTALAKARNADPFADRLGLESGDETGAPSGAPAAQ